MGRLIIAIDCDDVLVDLMRPVVDRTAHLGAMLAAVMQEVILFGDYAWNNTVELPSGVMRRSDWGRVDVEVSRIAGR